MKRGRALRFPAFFLWPPTVRQSVLKVKQPIKLHFSLKSCLLGLILKSVLLCWWCLSPDDRRRWTNHVDGSLVECVEDCCTFNNGQRFSATSLSCSLSSIIFWWQTRIGNYPAFMLSHTKHRRQCWRVDDALHYGGLTKMLLVLIKSPANNFASHFMTIPGYIGGWEESLLVCAHNRCALLSMNIRLVA